MVNALLISLLAMNITLIFVLIQMQREVNKLNAMLEGKQAAPPETFRMTLNGEQRTMTLPEAVQYWKFERAKHAVGSSRWSAYNHKLHEVGASGD